MFMKSEKGPSFWKIYLPIFIIAISLFFGAGLVLSQTTPGSQLPTGSSISNPGHASEEILCNGCVKSVNVNQNEICTSISGVPSLGCPPQGSGGAGGSNGIGEAYFFQVSVPVGTQSTWTDIPQSGDVSVGIDWNGKWVYLITMPTNLIIGGEGFQSGQSGGYTVKGKYQDGAFPPTNYEDHRVLQLDTTTSKLAYLKGAGSTQNIIIYIRANPTNTNVLQFLNLNNNQNGGNAYFIIRPLPNPV